MKTLFYALCISIILAVSFLLFSFVLKFKNNLQKCILYILRGIAIIFLSSILVYLIFVDILLAFFYLLACLGIFLITDAIFGIIIEEDFETNFICLVLGLFLGIIGGIGTLTSNFETSYKELPEKEVEIVLNDYSSEEKITNEKITIIELSKSNDNTKSFIIQTYNSDIELPFHDNYIDEYEIVENEKNKIVITTTESTGIDLLAFFEIRKPNISQSKKYTLYVNSNDILYN